MYNPFWNLEERRLRALWRLLLHGVLVYFAVSFAAGVIALTADLRLASRLGTLVGVLGATLAAAHLLDRRPLAGYGLRLDRAWWLDLGAGLALGVLLMAGVFGAEVALGWVEVTAVGTASGGYADGRFWEGLAVAAVEFLCVGIYEEVLSRGYHLRNMAEGVRLPRLGARGGLVLAWLLSSLLFGLGHAFNPNASIVSTLNVAAAGLLLGLPVVLTGRLGLAVGLHITWNFAQGPIFGFPVSGVKGYPAQVFVTTQQGPELWTGGAFGPEAGLLGLAAMLTGAALILLWVRLREGTVRLHRAFACYESASLEQP